MKVYEACATALLKHGIGVMFGLMGDANMLYVASYREQGGQFIATVHESGAVAMADGWSRMTRRVGVATVTHGPGLTNTMTSLVEAVRSHSHLLLLTGDTPAEPTHFQRLDLGEFAAAAGAGYDKVHRRDTLVRDLNRALQRVLAENRPILLNIPADLIIEDAGVQAAVTPPTSPPLAVTSPEALDSALALILSAKRPLVLAGRGAVLSDAGAALADLADAVAAPLSTSVLGKDLFRGHPSNLGICGSVARRVTASAMAQADLVIAFGASLNVFTTFHGELLTGKKVIQVDNDPGRFGWYVAADEYIAGDAKAVAIALRTALLAIDHTPSHTRWLASVQQSLADFRPADDYVDRSTANTVDVRTATLLLNDVLPADRTVVTDLGRANHAVWANIEVPNSGRFTTMGGFGAVGLGLAGAIGAAVANPEQLTVASLGDGGFMMHLAEFATAVRLRLPLLVLVFNDSAYGTEYAKLRNNGIDARHSLNDWPDFEPIAREFGGGAMSIRKIEEIEKLRGIAKELRSPFLVDIKLDPEVDSHS